MLFDLRGRRRHVIRFAYGFLAVAFGAGSLIFFVGSGFDFGGSIFDIFDSGGKTEQTDYSARIKQYQKQVAANPEKLQAWNGLMALQYQVAAQDADQKTGQPTAKGVAELKNVTKTWEEFALKSHRTANPVMLMTAVRAYALTERAAEALGLQKQLTERAPTANNYFQLAILAYQVNDKDTGKHAAKMAVKKTPKEDRPGVRKRLKETVKQLAMMELQKQLNSKGGMSGIKPGGKGGPQVGGQGTSGFQPSGATGSGGGAGTGGTAPSGK